MILTLPTISLAALTLASTFASPPPEMVGVPEPAMQVDAAPQGLSFLTAEAVLWSDRTSTIPLALDAPAEEETTWEITSSDPSCLKVLGPARALEGESFAFVRVRASGSGKASLGANGGRLRVEIKSLPSQAEIRQPKPSIVAPAQGSHVWGIFAVGVEFPPGADADRASVNLIAVNGEALGLAREVEITRGPERRLVFDVDAAALPAGPLTFRAQARLGDESYESEVLSLMVCHPEGPEVIHLEWEATAANERPEGYGDGRPSVVRDSQASGGRALAVRGFNPMPLAAIDVPTSGRWQVMARMRGDLGAGAFPTVSLSLDAPYTYAASVRAVDREWHRMPVGPPIELERGNHLIGLRLANAVDAGRAEQRHLYVDTLELVQTAGSGAPSEGAMMSMDAMAKTEPSMGMMAAAMAQASERRSAPPAGEHWIGLHTIFDGHSMTGELKLEGFASWSGGDAIAAPLVTLVVDGKPIASAQTSEPIFSVFPEELGPGEHLVQLRSSQPGRGSRETPLQALRVHGSYAHAPGRREYRVTSMDESWRLEGGASARGQLFRPNGPVTATIDLPDEWTGKFTLSIDARGPGGSHAAEAHLRVDGMRDGESRTLGEDTLEVKNWWKERRVGELVLESGPKTVTLKLTPDASGEPGASTLEFRSLIFARAPGYDDNPPLARIVYPKSGHTTFGLDAVVVEASDDRSLSEVELLIDGRPSGSFARAPEGAGRIVLPLWASDLMPGEHTAAVRVLDDAKNQCDSTPVTFTVLAGPPAEPGAFRRAVHLLDRLAYGPSTQDLGRLLALGEDRWLEDSFTRSAGDLTATELARATLGQDLPYAAAQLALRAALMTDNPVRSRLAFFVDNHFSTWAGKTGVPSEYGDHVRWQGLGFAPFAELLMANVTNPVMLIYLDQQLSFRGRLNENFARELLELHTVGAGGGYDQEDVTELAGLLTGLTVSEEAPPTGSGQYRRRVLRFAPDLASEAGADVMGTRFGSRADEPFKGGYGRIERIVEHLAAHPKTARFWATKLAESYVQVPAPEPLVADLELAYHRSGGDPRELLRTLAGHPDFWGAMGTPRMATPFDFALRLGRATTPRHLHGSLDGYMKEAGMGLFDHAAPDGYPVEDAAYIDSNAMLSRWRVAQKFPWATRVLVPEEARRGFGDGTEALHGRAIAHAAFALLGRTLGEESTRAAADFMGELMNEPAWKRVDQMTVLLTRLPEASIR